MRPLKVRGESPALRWWVNIYQQFLSLNAALVKNVPHVAAGIG